MDLAEIMTELRRLTYGVDDDFGSTVAQQRASLAQTYFDTVMQDVQAIKSTKTDEKDAEAQKDAEVPAEAEPAVQEVEEEGEEDTNDADEPIELPTLERALSVVQSIGGEWNW